jgi:hypothetical protein
VLFAIEEDIQAKHIRLILTSTPTPYPPTPSLPCVPSSPHHWQRHLAARLYTSHHRLLHQLTIRLLALVQTTNHRLLALGAILTDQSAPALDIPPTDHSAPALDMHYPICTDHRLLALDTCTSTAIELAFPYRSSTTNTRR